MRNIHAMDGKTDIKLIDDQKQTFNQDERLGFKSQLVNDIYKNIYDNDFDAIKLGNQILDLIKIITPQDLDQKQEKKLQFILKKHEDKKNTLRYKYKLEITGDNEKYITNREISRIINNDQINYFMNYYPQNLSHLIKIECYDKVTDYKPMGHELFIKIDDNMCAYFNILTTDGVPIVTIIDKKLSKNKFISESCNFNIDSLSVLQPKDENDLKNFKTKLKSLKIHKVNLQFSYLETTIRFIDSDNKSKLLKLYPLVSEIIKYYRLANSITQISFYSMLVTDLINLLEEKIKHPDGSKTKYKMPVDLINTATGVHPLIALYRYKISDKINERTFFMVLYNKWRNGEDSLNSKSSGNSYYEPMKKFNVNYVYSDSIKSIVCSGFFNPSTNISIYHTIQLNFASFLNNCLKMFYNHLYTYYGNEINCKIIFKSENSLLDHIRSQLNNTSYKFNNLFAIFIHIQVFSFATNYLKNKDNIGLDQLIGAVNNYFRFKPIYDAEYLNKKIMLILQEHFIISDPMIQKFISNIINKNDESVNPLWLLSIFFGIRGLKDSSKIDVLLDELINDDLYSNLPDEHQEEILMSQKTMFVILYFYAFCASKKNLLDEKAIKNVNKGVSEYHKNNLSLAKDNKKMLKEYFKMFVLLNHKAKAYSDQSELSNINIKLYVNHKGVQKYIQLVFDLDQEDYETQRDQEIMDQSVEKNQENDMHIKNYNKNRISKLSIQWEDYIKLYKNKLDLDNLFKDLKICEKVIFYYIEGKNQGPNRSYKVPTISFYDSNHNKDYLSIKKYKKFDHMLIDVSSVNAIIKPFFNQCLYQELLPEMVTQLCNCILNLYHEQLSDIRENKRCPYSLGAIDQYNFLKKKLDSYNYEEDSEKKKSLQLRVDERLNLLNSVQVNIVCEYLSGYQVNNSHKDKYDKVLCYIAHLLLEKEIEYISSVNTADKIIEYNNNLLDSAITHKKTYQ